MCYALPGPRCSSHASKAFTTAKVAYAQDPNDLNRAALIAAKEDYLTTPAGINDLHARGKSELAEKHQALRQAKIDELKAIEDRTHGLKWSSIALKEMDPGALTQALHEASVDPTIDWGDSSREDFLRAINHATFLHRAQTRANRAGFPRTPYIEHPLRNTLRLYRWTCTSGEVLTSSVLHDTVEDCAEEMSGGETDPLRARIIAEEKIYEMYSPSVGRIVSGTTNPILPKGTPREKKVKSYLSHLQENLYDPDVFATKVVDFGDNAGGLHHNLIPGQERMVSNMTIKYSQAQPIFEDSLRSTENLPFMSIYPITRSLERTRERLRLLRDELDLH